MSTDIFAYFLAILRGDIELEEINKTYIVLIPKVSKSKSMTQYRPISLCNVLYKIITKTVVNRMSNMLDSCINEA